MWEQEPGGPSPLPPIRQQPAPEIAPADVPWRARDAFPVALIAILGGLALSLPIMAFVDGDSLRAGILLASEAALGLAVWLWLRLRYRVGLARAGVRWQGFADVKTGLLAGLLGVLLAEFVVGPLIVQLVEAIQGEPVEFPRQLEFDDPAPGILALTAVTVVLVAPVAEEIFFRGLLYRGLRKWMSKRGAMVLSAAIFAVTHGFPLIMPAIFVLGLILAHVVERRGSLVPAITAHVLFNAIGYTIFLSTL